MFEALNMYNTLELFLKYFEVSDGSLNIKIKINVFGTGTRPEIPKSWK